MGGAEGEKMIKQTKEYELGWSDGYKCGHHSGEYVALLILPLLVMRMAVELSLRKAKLANLKKKRSKK